MKSREQVMGHFPFPYRNTQTHTLVLDEVRELVVCVILSVLGKKKSDSRVGSGTNQSHHGVMYGGWGEAH